MYEPSAIRIGDRLIGQDHPPFVIAEMSGNHNQSLKRALEIVDAAAASGAHAIKLQTYTPDTMTLDLDEREFHIGNPDSLWSGTSLYKLYREAHTPWEWHGPLFRRARELGLTAFSTPFDATAVEFLEKHDVPCYKIASFENTDLPLIRRVAQTGKPVIMSTGMASADELQDAVDAARAEGCRSLVLLKCTSTYPATPENSNIRTIPDLRERYQCEVGLSDHTIGVGVAVASVALGVTVVEKHFTLRRADGGVDSAFSMEPEEMAGLIVETERAWQALGRVSYGPLEAEKASIQFRRSLYIVQDLRAGDLLTPSNVRAIRPGFGLATKHLEAVLYKRIKRDVSRGTALRWDLIE
jgi:pseudaminic acid synthase